MFQAKRLAVVLAAFFGFVAAGIRCTLRRDAELHRPFDRNIYLFSRKATTLFIIDAENWRLSDTGMGLAHTCLP